MNMWDSLPLQIFKQYYVSFWKAAQAQALCMMQDLLKEILVPMLSGKSDYLILMILANFIILNYKYN